MTAESPDVRLPEAIQGRQLVLRWDRDRDPLELRRREWLITNGLGGYASGTIAGLPTRKYHGLFVPNLAAPKGRHIMISRCDESVVTPVRQLYFGGAEFENERVVGESHQYLKEFRLDHLRGASHYGLFDVREGYAVIDRGSIPCVYPVEPLDGEV